MQGELHLACNLGSIALSETAAMGRLQRQCLTLQHRQAALRGPVNYPCRATPNQVANLVLAEAAMLPAQFRTAGGLAALQVLTFRQ